MDELELICNGFISRMGEGERYSNISEEIIKKYKGVFLINGEKEDIVNYLWKNLGLSTYKNGLFWFVNPDEYSTVARKFPNVSNNAIVFARTGLGNLFLLDDGITGKNINFLNVHNGQLNLVSRGFADFIEFMIPSESVWKTDCYGKIELKATKENNLLPDECLTFVPALALGGDEKLSNLQKVKIKENLAFLAQLHNK